MRPVRRDSQWSPRPGLAHEHLRSQGERNTCNNSLHFHLPGAVRDTRIRVESPYHPRDCAERLSFLPRYHGADMGQFGTRLPKYSFCIFQSVPGSSTLCDKHVWVTGGIP